MAILDGRVIADGSQQEVFDKIPTVQDATLIDRVPTEGETEREPKLYLKPSSQDPSLASTDAKLLRHELQQKSRRDLGKWFGVFRGALYGPCHEEMDILRLAVADNSNADPVVGVALQARNDGVSFVRRPRHNDPLKTDVRWFDRELPNLKLCYPNVWVAVLRKQVVATGASGREAALAALRKDVKCRPYVRFVKV